MKVISSIIKFIALSILCGIVWVIFGGTGIVVVLALSFIIGLVKHSKTDKPVDKRRLP